MSNFLVSTGWLALRLQSPDVAVIDASWHLPATRRDAMAEYEEGHIPGARFYDLDAGSAPGNALPHMLPTAEKFTRDMKALGVDNKNTVVVYDAAGLFSAARLWWMLNTFGNRNVMVLDGGLPKWKREGHSLEQGKSIASPATAFTAQFDAKRVKSSTEVASALAKGTAQVADARSPSRFRGEEPEPRPGVKPGHMPGAINVHYSGLFNNDGTFKKGAALRQAFEAAGIDLKRPVIASCGSGVTASILMLGLAELGIKDASLYDGSWAEWGASDQALVTG